MLAACIDVSNESFCLEHKVREAVLLLYWSIKGPYICMMEAKSVKYLVFSVFDVKCECNAIKKALFMKSFFLSSLEKQ